MLTKYERRGPPELRMLGPENTQTYKPVMYILCAEMPL